jgi:nicotinamide-nucleotide amidase
MPTFDLLSTGAEVICGDIVDTNSAWLCQQFFMLGLTPNRLATVGDIYADICDVLKQAIARSDCVVMTGGLGPTTDDLTRQAAADVFKMPLYQDEAALAQVTERYVRRGRPLTSGCYQQALLPQGAVLLENKWGTAPCFRIDTDRGTAFFLPGVPSEMKALFEEYVRPYVMNRFKLSPRRRHILRCIGLAESVANERMRGFAWPGITVGYRAAMPEIHVKLELEPGVEGKEALSDAKMRLGREVFGVDCGPLEEVVADLLIARKQSLATAESCTAGRIAALLTARPGASVFYLGGAVVYANSEKVRQCGVEPAVLEEHGAVSEPVARALAEGIRKATRADWGLAVTGIAGPGGGSEEKPVGTVHIAVASQEYTSHRQLFLPGDRERIMRFTAGAALELLRRKLLS